LQICAADGCCLSPNKPQTNRHGSRRL
jgi:hypothetical protein